MLFGLNIIRVGTRTQTAQLRIITTRPRLRIGRPLRGHLYITLVQQVLQTGN
ncbi:hypothetical protein ACQPZ2_02060 [Nocardia pseudovaccinii]|uniref:hypothetical protein n=1 Tax=Nocardia pseudovaccinii TaxID=189540 RepID=UPI003D8AC379